MTRPIDVLVQEHALHRRMLAVLGRIVTQVERGARFPAGDVATVLGYLREFVEASHHAKEAALLHPLAMSIADDRFAEAVGRLIADREQTTWMLQSLMLFWEPGDLLPEERVGFCELARRYSARLLRDMSIEERELYPVAAKLDAAEARDVLEEFQRIATGRRSRVEWLGVAAGLEERWVD